jgi:DNA replicative helicase MCM subunit Mcm2 (Cdc46/Mcm family)
MLCCIVIVMNDCDSLVVVTVVRNADEVVAIPSLNCHHISKLLLSEGVVIRMSFHDQAVTHATFGCRGCVLFHFFVM